MVIQDITQNKIRKALGRKAALRPWRKTINFNHI